MFITIAGSGDIPMSVRAMKSGRGVPDEAFSEIWSSNRLALRLSVPRLVRASP
jgi:hypothetical protein